VTRKKWLIFSVKIHDRGCYVRGKCYRSMKKNEAPWSLHVSCQITVSNVMFLIRKQRTQSLTCIPRPPVFWHLYKFGSIIKCIILAMSHGINEMCAQLLVYKHVRQTHFLNCLANIVKNRGVCISKSIY